MQAVDAPTVHYSVIQFCVLQYKAKQGYKYKSVGVDVDAGMNPKCIDWFFVALNLSVRDTVRVTTLMTIQSTISL